MAENSKIEWTHHTANFWRGCTKVSEGCANCYAETLSKRNPKTLGIWGPMGKRVVAAEAFWREPLKWDAAAQAAGERHRVFCSSLADILEDWTGAMTAHTGEQLWVDGDGWTTKPGGRTLAMCEVRRRVYATINATTNLDWLLLTKRPENARTMLPDRWLDIRWPDNVWLGTSIENQAAADERIPHLLRVPAAVRFLSVEPLLGPVDLAAHKWFGDRKNTTMNLLTGICNEIIPGTDIPNGRWMGGGIDWVIVGGESGNGARPLHPDWVRSIRNQCQGAAVRFFFKQWGEYCPAEIAPEPEPVLTPILDRSISVMKKPGRSFVVVRPDGGNRVNLPDGRFSGDSPQESDAWMVRVGKKIAGRLLDGREWSEFPETPCAS